MNKKTSLWSGVSVLIVAVLAVMAFIRGNVQIWLLSVAFAAWAVWAAVKFLLPYLKAQKYRHEARKLRKKSKQQSPKYLSKDISSHATTMHLQDIQCDRASENIAGRQDELMVQLETELILHALAKKLPSKEMRIIRMKLDGAGMHDIAKAERITFHDIKQLLAGTYDTVVQVLLG